MTHATEHRTAIWHRSLWHRLRYGHWIVATLTETGECLHCAMRWNPERGYWEVR